MLRDQKLRATYDRPYPQLPDLWTWVPKSALKLTQQVFPDCNLLQIALQKGDQLWEPRLGRPEWGLLGEGGLRMFSPCTNTAGMSLTGGKRGGKRSTSAAPNRSQIWSTIWRFSIHPLTWVSVSTESPPLPLGPLRHEPLSGTKICPVPKEKAGGHAFSGCAIGSPSGDWCETPPLCCPSWRWHESVPGMEESEWELDEPLSTPGNLCARLGTCLTRHRKPALLTPLQRKLGSCHTKRVQRQAPDTLNRRGDGQEGRLSRDIIH